MNINEVMSVNVKSCHADSSLDEIARLMWDNDCGAIPVINEKNIPIGIVTDRDIAMTAMHNHQPLWELKASRVIQGQRLFCSHQEDDVENCLTKMEQNGVRRILVTNQDGTLAGIVSMGDIVAATSSRKGKTSLGVTNVLGMLKQVSGHHGSPSQAVASQ